MGRKLNSSGLTNVLLFVLAFACSTISYVLTTEKAVATAVSPVKYELNVNPKEDPNGFLNAVIDFKTGSIIQLESSASIKDLSVVINHPDTVFIDNQLTAANNNDQRLPAGDRVFNIYRPVELKIEHDTVFYNPYPRLPLRELKANDPLTTYLDKSGLPSL